MTRFTESVLEDATLTWPERLGYQVLYGPAIAPGEPDSRPGSARTAVQT
jgi:hypothetical protein